MKFWITWLQRISVIWGGLIVVYTTGDMDSGIMVMVAGAILFLLPEEKQK